MGTGTDAARAAGGGAHADAIDNMKDQLLIVLLNRLKNETGEVLVPVAELDGTGDFVVSFQVLVDGSQLRFVVGRKQ